MIYIYLNVIKLTNSVYTVTTEGKVGEWGGGVGVGGVQRRMNMCRKKRSTKAHDEGMRGIL